MNPQYAQANVRVQLSILSNPPVAPVDINTGLPPKFWRGGDVEVDVGIFDGSENGLDLSNLAALQIALSPSPTSPYPWLIKTVNSGGGGIVSPIDFGDWQNGVAQNARFILNAAATDLGLLAGASRQFWMTITGFTNAGAIIVYGGGYVTLYNPGMTNPPATAGVVSFNAQTLPTGNGTVNPQATTHTEEINFDGAAGTYNVLLAVAGYPKGSRVDVLCLFPNLTPGIAIKFFTGSIVGSPIATWTTDAFQPNGLFKFVLNASGEYDLLEKTIPAFVEP